MDVNNYKSLQKSVKIKIFMSVVLLGVVKENTKVCLSALTVRTNRLIFSLVIMLI